MDEEIQLYEASNRTMQGRYLLRPGPEANEIIRSTLARAQKRYGIQLVAASFLSNHFHLLFWAATVEQTADFMRYFQSNVARKVGKLYDWSGPFWERRYSIEPVGNSEEDQVWRLRYLLKQGCKEGLVWTPKEWPGVHTVREILTGKPLQGLWLNQTDKYRSELRGEDRPLSHFQELEQCELVSLPCWKHLPKKEYQKRVAALVREIEEETRRQHVESRTVPLGKAAILRRDPHHRPHSVKRTPAPWILTRSADVRERYRQAYAWFLRAYREKSKRFRSGEFTTKFPAGCFPPRPPAFAQTRAPA